MSESPEIFRRGELDVIRIDNAACSAEVTLFGGHILHWQPSGQKPVLWMSENSAFDGVTALRGGVPICWPWFGEKEGQEKHGIVRSQLWQLDHYQESTDTTTLQLSIILDPSMGSGPFPKKVSMLLRFGATLEQTLTFENTSEAPQCFAYALHNYFRVSSPDNIAIPQLENSIYHDKVEQLSQQIDTGSRDHCGPIDRVYLNDKAATLVDSGYDRTIAVEKTDSQNWVLWNPGKDAGGIADIHPGGEKEYLCFEVANTADVSLPPGETLTIGQVISIS